MYDSAMFSLNRARTAALTAVIVLPMALAAHPASAVTAAKGGKGKQTVVGTLKWTIVTTIHDPGDPSDLGRTTEDSTVTEEHTLMVKAVRDPGFTRTYVFKQGKASYQYSYSAHRETSAYDFGAVNCQSATDGTATGSGKATIAPNLLGKYNPNKDVLVIDKRTKGISIHAVLKGTGTETTAQHGFGTNPCGDGQWTDPLSLSGSTTLNDSRNVCLPKGLKRSQTQSASPLFGKWNQKTKKFAFDCSKQFSDEPNHTTTKITVTGSLKYRR